MDAMGAVREPVSACEGLTFGKAKLRPGLAFRRSHHVILKCGFGTNLAFAPLLNSGRVGAMRWPSLWWTTLYGNAFRRCYRRPSRVVPVTPGASRSMTGRR